MGDLMKQLTNLQHMILLAKSQWTKKMNSVPHGFRWLFPLTSVITAQVASSTLFGANYLTYSWSLATARKGVTQFQVVVKGSVSTSNSAAVLYVWKQAWQKLSKYRIGISRMLWCLGDNDYIFRIH